MNWKTYSRINLSLYFLPVNQSLPFAYSIDSSTFSHSKRTLKYWKIEKKTKENKLYSSLDYNFQFWNDISIKLWLTEAFNGLNHLNECTVKMSSKTSFFTLHLSLQLLFNTYSEQMMRNKKFLRNRFKEKNQK